MASQCWFCGEPISLWREIAGGIHPECKKAYEANLTQFKGLLIEAATSDEVIDEGESRLLDLLASTGSIREEDRKKIGLEVYQSLRQQAVGDGYLTAGERDQLKSLQSYVGLDDQVAKASELDRVRTLTNIIEGNLPQITPSINLQKNEVAYLETITTWCHLKTRRRRKAGTRTQRVRVAKGIYIKFQGTPGPIEEWRVNWSSQINGSSLLG